jgi:hypothetical protein
MDATPQRGSVEETAHREKAVLMQDAHDWPADFRDVNTMQGKKGCASGAASSQRAQHAQGPRLNLQHQN